MSDFDDMPMASKVATINRKLDTLRDLAAVARGRHTYPRDAGGGGQAEADGTRATALLR